MKVVNDLKVKLKTGPISYEEATKTLEKISDLKILVPALNVIIGSKQMSKEDLNELNHLSSFFFTANQLNKLADNTKNWNSTFNQLAALSPPSIRKRLLERLLTMINEDTKDHLYINKASLTSWIKGEIAKINKS